MLSQPTAPSLTHPEQIGVHPVSWDNDLHQSRLNEVNPDAHDRHPAAMPIAGRPSSVIHVTTGAKGWRVHRFSQREEFCLTVWHRLNGTQNRSPLLRLVGGFVICPAAITASHSLSVSDQVRPTLRSTSSLSVATDEGQVAM